MPPILAAPRECQRRALCARERSQRVTPNDLSREHAALVKAAVAESSAAASSWCAGWRLDSVPRRWPVS